MASSTWVGCVSSAMPMSQAPHHKWGTAQARSCCTENPPRSTTCCPSYGKPSTEAECLGAHLCPFCLPRHAYLRGMAIGLFDHHTGDRDVWTVGANFLTVSNMVCDPGDSLGPLWVGYSQSLATIKCQLSAFTRLPLRLCLCLLLAELRRSFLTVSTRPKAVIQLFFQSCHFIDGEWSREHGSTAC
jgi:hypothetical protein